MPPPRCWAGLTLQSVQTRDIERLGIRGVEDCKRFYKLINYIKARFEASIFGGNSQQPALANPRRKRTPQRGHQDPLSDGRGLERKAASAPVLPGLGRKSVAPHRRLHSSGRGNKPVVPRPPSEGSRLPRFERRHIAHLDDRDSATPGQRVAEYNANLLSSIARTNTTTATPDGRRTLALASREAPNPAGGGSIGGNGHYMLERNQRIASEVSEDDFCSDDSIDSVGADSIEDNVFASSTQSLSRLHRHSVESNPVNLQSVEPGAFRTKHVARESAPEPQHVDPEPARAPVASDQGAAAAVIALADDDIDRSNTKIRVCVRKRPLSKKEKRRNDVDVVEDVDRVTCCINNNKVAVDMTSFNQQHNFIFDEMFGDQCSNDEIYTKTAQPLIKNVLDGCMATCFAYGQTGAGKTHTMMGVPGKVDGLYALGAQELVQRIQADPQYSELQVMVSFYEIYCGKLYDLLNKRGELFAREDGVGRIHIRGIERVQVHKAEDIMSAIERGNRSRITGQTGANDTSSRSHAVVQLEINEPAPTKKRGRRAGEASFRLRGRLCFIDLAGSERASDTKDNDKQRRMEGAEINTSLLALKECIRGLDSDAVHVPFRQSKLTMVLKDSFVGNSRTCMIACVAPGLSSCEHSLNTLRYADRVKELGGSGVGGSSVVSDRRNPNVVAGTARKSGTKRPKKASTKKKKGKPRPTWNDEFVDEPQRPSWNNDIHDNHDAATTASTSAQRKSTGRTPRPDWNGAIADHRESRSRQKKPDYNGIKVDSNNSYAAKYSDGKQTQKKKSARSRSATRSADNRWEPPGWNGAIVDYRETKSRQARSSSAGGGSRQASAGGGSRQGTPRARHQVAVQSSRRSASRNGCRSRADSAEPTPRSAPPVRASPNTPRRNPAADAAAARGDHGRRPAPPKRSRPPRHKPMPNNSAGGDGSGEALIIWPGGEDFGRPPLVQPHHQRPDSQHTADAAHHNRPPSTAKEDGAASLWPEGDPQAAGEGPASLWPTSDMNYASDMADYAKAGAVGNTGTDTRHPSQPAHDADDGGGHGNAAVPCDHDDDAAHHSVGLSTQAKEATGYSTLSTRVARTPPTLVGRDPVEEAKEALIASLWPEGEGDFTNDDAGDRPLSTHVSPLRGSDEQQHTLSSETNQERVRVAGGKRETPTHVRAQRKKWAKPDRILVSPSIHVVRTSLCNFL